MEEVILVNENDEEVGTLEKMQAHREGLLHRAFSVFLLNHKGEMLIHRRAKSKYHSGGLWTNACCSHPKPKESTSEAAARRLMEEMGIACELKHSFSFLYKAQLDNELTEHEFDHVFIGEFSQIPAPNSEEVEDWKYIPITQLLHEVRENPENFTEWFKIALPEFCKQNNLNQ